MRYVKFLGGLVGVILVGALGSAVWDLALKPAVPWLWDRTAAIASLGVAAIRNVPYQDAARGSPFDGLLSLVNARSRLGVWRCDGQNRPSDLASP